MSDINEHGNHILQPDFWDELKRYTDARIALGHTGASLPTKEHLRFTLDHAMARDAVHKPFDRLTVEQRVEALNLGMLSVHSDAPSRHVFIAQPDRGRRLCAESRSRLEAYDAKPSDVVFVVADGLSSRAAEKQAVPLLKAVMPYMEQLNLSVGPVVVAEQSRVALGDEIAWLLHGSLVAILIGERPGLSAPDSLGVYITYDPHPGRLESERNCISNIRPEGLTYDRAAFKMAWIMEAALRLGHSGTTLKDQSDDPRCCLAVKPMIE